MLRWAMVRDMFPHLTYEKIKSIEKVSDDFQNTAPRKQIEIFADKDFEKALGFCTPPVQAILRLMRITGARPTEICTMKICDLDCSDPDCWIYLLTEHKTKKKTGTDKIIGLGPTAQKIIRAFMEHCENENDYLFKPTRKENERYDHHAIYTALRRACIKAGVKHINPYLARHTAITRANDDALSINAGKDLVSHANSKTTKRYDHATIERIKKITKQLDKAS
jgi:integrase